MPLLIRLGPVGGSSECRSPGIALPRERDLTFTPGRKTIHEKRLLAILTTRKLGPRQTVWMKRSWQKLGSIPASRRAQPTPVSFQLSFQCRRDFSTTLPALSSEARDNPTRPQHIKSFGELRMEARMEREAREARRHQGTHSGYFNHNKVYSRYLAVVDSEGADPLPLEVHQAVLRACTLLPGDIRARTARLLREEKVTWNRLVHPYQSRFQKIVLNILNAGLRPSIKDYHFIMSQFAAAGDYAGIHKYMRYMTETGLETDGRAFGFYLQAIAQQISVAAPTSERTTVVPKLVGFAIQAIREMNDRKIPPSSANADLAFRILSEVHNSQSLTAMVKSIYGMDLNYLDSPPIDTTDSSLGVQPFSTHALNSLLRRLGQWGQISKMVYAFETLTNPLPLPTKPDNTFDDDDDDFLPIQQVWKPPSPEPNPTAYNTLIKHCITRKYPALAKHYTRQLMLQERQRIRWLRNELKSKPSNEDMVPHAGVTLQTLRPICTFASMSHDVALLKWAIQVAGLSIKRKYWSCIFIDRIESRNGPRQAPPTSGTLATPEPSSSSSPLSKSWGSLAHNISVHRLVLKRDLLQLYELRQDLKERLFWMIARKRVRLGKRVWRGKSVYLRHRNARVRVGREMWKKTVNFREDKLKRLKEKRKPEEVKPKWKWKKYKGKHFDPAIANIGWSRKLRRS